MGDYGNVLYVLYSGLYSFDFNCDLFFITFKKY